MNALLPPQKPNIPKAGKILWWYRKAYHHLYCRGVRPVLCNSFQKSGTHLLVGVVTSLPQFQQYGRKAYWHYLTRTRVDSTKISNPSQVVKMLTQCLPGEVYRGHIGANAELQAFFATNRMKHLFIFRDLRDVVVSYFFGMKARESIDTWVSRYFYSLPSDEERFDFLIEGFPSEIKLEGFPRHVLYPNIGERFRENIPWVEDENCLSVRFEDLVNPETQNQAHLRIARYLLPNSEEKVIRDAVQHMPEGHNPKKSKTFRKGTSGEWKKHFTKAQKNTFKDVAGQILIDLGYEKDFDW